MWAFEHSFSDCLLWNVYAALISFYFYNPNFVIAIMSRKLNGRCGKLLFVSLEFNVLCVFVIPQWLSVQFVCVFMCVLCFLKSVKWSQFTISFFVLRLCVAMPFDGNTLRLKLHTICALGFYLLCSCVSQTMRNKTTASIRILVTNTCQNDRIEIETHTCWITKYLR